MKGRITYTIPEPVEIKNISELGNGEGSVFLLICPSKQVNFRQYNRIERAGARVYNCIIQKQQPLKGKSRIGGVSDQSWW